MNSQSSEDHPEISHQACTRHVDSGGGRHRCLHALASLCLIISIGILVSGCPPPTTTTTSHTLSGKLLDAYTGLPISGGTVEFAGATATSDSDGTYSLDLGEGPGIVTGTFSYHATEYQVFSVDGAPLDSSVDSTITWTLTRTDSSSPVTHSFSGTVRTDQGGLADVPSDSALGVTVVNENGGHWSSRYVNTSGADYTCDTPTWGSDCIVSFFVKPPNAEFEPFYAIFDHVDLSGATATLDIDEDSSSELTITVTGDADGNQGNLFLISSGTLLYGADFVLDGNAQATLRIANPLGCKGLWSQTAQIPSISGKQISICSEIVNLASSVTLPKVPDRGPNEAPDVNSLDYDQVTGTLSIDPVAGATMINFLLFDANFQMLGILASSTGTFVVPDWLKTQFQGQTVTVMVMANDSNFTTLFETAQALSSPFGAAASEMEVGQVMSNGFKQVTF